MTYPNSTLASLAHQNYAIMTVAWATGPYAYWYMFVEYIDDDFFDDDDDDDKNDDHATDRQSSLIWFMSCACLVLAAIVMKFVAGDATDPKLKPGV